MQKPTWVKVIGTILILLGCFGALGAVQIFSLPKVMAMQRQMMPELKKELETSKPDNSEQTMQLMEKMSRTPPWFETWCQINGTVSLFISGLVIFCAVCLFQLKKSAIRIFYGVMAADICWKVVRTIAAVKSMNMLGLSMLILVPFVILLNIILLIAVATRNKEVFVQQEVGNPLNNAI